MDKQTPAFVRMIAFFLAIQCGIPLAAPSATQLAAAEPQPPITRIAFDPTARTVVAASQSGLQTFSWPELRPIRTIALEMANINCFAFSSDGKRLVVGGGDPSESGMFSVLAWPKAELLFKARTHSDAIRDVLWLDAQSLATASLDRTIHIWRNFETLKSSKPTRTLRGHSRGVHALGWIPSAKLLMSAGADQSLRTWGQQDDQPARSFQQHTRPIRAIAIRPEKEGPDVAQLPMAATASEDRTLRFWQPTIGRMVRFVRLESAPLSIAWHPQGDVLAASCEDGSVRLINPMTVQVTSKLPAIDGWAYGVAFHPMGEALVVAGSDGQLRRLKMPKPSRTPDSTR